MDLVVLGSSDAFNGAGRCHSAYVLRDEGAPPLVIDFGATTLFALRRAGMIGTDLGAVLITHLHGDHFGGLPFLLLDGMYHDVRSEPLELVGAVGLEQRLDALFHALYRDVAARERAFETRIAELHPGDTRDVIGYRVEAFAASHMDPPDLPLCLRITGPSGRVIAFSGDTEPCEGFYQAARGADLLVAECTGLRPPCGRHLSWDDWREMLGKAEAKRILLSHLSREVREEIPRLLAECPPGIDLFFADDLQRITISTSNRDAYPHRGSSPMTLRRTTVPASILAALLALAPTLGSCGSAKQIGDLLAPYTPKLRFQRLAVDKIDFTSIGVDFIFAVQNPNPISVKLDEFGYSLGLEGVEFIKGRNTDGIALKSNGDTELSIPVALAFADIFKLVQNVDGKDDIAFSLAGDFGFKTPVGLARVPFKEEGRFPVVRPPSISLKGAKLGEFNVLKNKAVLNVSLGFKNDKGGAPVSFKGFDYKLDLAGTPVSSGVLENVPDAAAGQEQAVTLPINLDLLKLGKTMITVLKGKNPVDVHVTAKVMVGTPFGAIPLDLAETAAYLLK